jgi:hypothetical protein
MKNNRGFTVLGVVGAGLATVIVVMLIMFGMSYVSYNNLGAAMDAQVKAEWTNNQNILSSYTLKVKEAAHVPDKYQAALKDIVSSTFHGRYGDNGSQATVQWIRENNIQFDASMYKQIQQIIESGRNDFKISQTKLIDLKRQYEVEQNSVWSGFWLRMTGYPKVPLSQYTVVIEAGTTEKFKTGVDQEVKF